MLADREGTSLAAVPGRQHSAPEPEDVREGHRRGLGHDAGPARRAHAARFSFGPACFDLTSSSALVWLRPDGRAWVQVEYSTRADFSEVSLTASVSATPDTDYTVVTELTRLTPDTEYFYRGVLSDRGRDPVRGATGRFRTAPETAKEFRFAWSGDMEAGQQPFRLLESVARQQPAFFLHLGDTIYADYPKDRFVATLPTHMALDIQQPDGLNEFLAGPIAAWPQCQMNRTAEERLKRTGRFFICDGPNYGLVKVRPDASPPEAEVGDRRREEHRPPPPDDRRLRVTARCGRPASVAVTGCGKRPAPRRSSAVFPGRRRDPRGTSPASRSSATLEVA